MKRCLGPLLIVLSVFALSFGAAHAQALTTAQSAALETRIAGFEAAFAKRDMAEVSSVIPPRVLAVMAEQFGIEPALLKAALADAMQQVMQNVTVDAYDMDVDGAVMAETSAGRTYLLIPTTTEMTVDGNTRIEARSQTLAFADKDVWYLVRIDEAQQVQFLTRAYPEFTGIDFPSGSTKILQD